MIEIGQALKEKRVAMGLTLSQVEQQTKIRRKYLEAIEDGDWSVLPGDVYARGFIRSYAEAVGLDGQELLSRLSPRESNVFAPPVTPGQSGQAPKSATAAKSPKPATVNRTVAPPPRRSTANGAKSMSGRGARRRSGIAVNGGQVAVVVGVLILLGAGWWALGRPHGSSSSQSTNHAGSQNLVSQNQTGNTVGNASGNNATAGNNSSVAPPPTPQVTVTAAPQPNGDVTYSVAAPTTQQLAATLTTTSAPCWVSVTKDGHLLGAGGQTLTANSSGSWTANSQLVIRVGNLTGISLKINGQAVALPNVNHPINVTVNKTSH